MRLSLLILLLIVFASLPCFSLSPQEIAVVYNEEPSVADASRGVALYYAEARGIPASNVIPLQATALEVVAEAQYVQTVASPISTPLAQHPHIKVIVLCYGIPSWINVATENGRQSVDSTLMLLGNEGALDPAKFRVAEDNLHDNPFYGSTMRFTGFRESALNRVDMGEDEQWKINYLVCRLDGYSTPVENVTVNNVSYSIPRDVKNIIDRARRANWNGRNGLSNAKIVLDDAPLCVAWRAYPAGMEANLNDLLEPLTGSPDNVLRESGTEESSNTYAVGTGGN